MKPFGSHLAQGAGLVLDTSDGTRVPLTGSLWERAGFSLLGIPHLGARLRHRLVMKCLAGRRFRTLVDAGCGAGFSLMTLLPYAGRAIGIDGSAARLGTGRSLAARNQLAGLHFARADVLRLPLRSASADGVIFSEVLEHIEEDGAALREIRRVLAPGGRLALTTTSNEEWNREEEHGFDHARPGYALEALTSLVESSGFVVEASESWGRAPLTRLLWRRHRAMTAGHPYLAAGIFPAVYAIAVIADALGRGPQAVGHVLLARAS